MKLLLLLFAALVLSSEGPSPVKSLTPADFDATVQASNVIVKFFAPWCGHCKHLAPEYVKVAEMFEGSKKIVVAEVDCDAEANKALCSKHGVQGYPTVKYFPQGQVKADVKFEGGRTAEDISKFIAEKTGERIRVAPKHYVDLTPEDFDSVVMDPKKHVIVAFTAPWCGHCIKLAPEYEKAAGSFLPSDNVVFAKVDADKHKDLATKYGVTGFPTIKYFAAGSADKTAADYNQGREAKDLVDFMNSQAGAERIIGGGLKLNAGRVAAFDELATKFTTAEPAKRAAVVAETKAKIAEVSEKAKWSAQFYVKTMENISSKGVSYLDAEKARLQKIIDSKSVAAQKMDEFTMRLNILQAF